MCPNDRKPHRTEILRYAAQAMEACTICGSVNHSRGGHFRLEWAYKRSGIGLRSLADEPMLDLDGTPGEPSPSERNSGQPDLLRIVPSVISVRGSMDFQALGPGVLRLWRKVPGEEGSIFTLSLGRSEEATELLDVLCGAPGSIVSAELKLFRTIPPLEPRTT